MTAAKGLRLPDYLRHILEAIIQVETYTTGIDQQEFFANVTGRNPPERRDHR